MNTISLSQGGSTLEIDDKGGCIISLILNSTPILGTFLRIDKVQSRSHICVPNFDTEGMYRYGLPKHGPARTGIWDIVEKSDSRLKMSYSIDPVGRYPSRLYAVQEWTLTEKSLTHTVTVTNQGPPDAPVNIALHYYWHTHGGWEGTTVNKNQVSDLIKADTYAAYDPDCTVVFPDGFSVKLALTGLPYLQFWTGREEVSNKTTYDDAYVCIEPCIGPGGYIDTKEAILKNTHQRSITAVLSIL